MDYIYSVSKIEFGTPTGAATLPGALAQLPDTVKGSITIEESEGATVKHFVDQKKEPIKVVKTEEGEMLITCQFNDFDAVQFAAFKGGTAVTGASASFTPSTGYTNVEKAIKITFDSAHTLEIYNANCQARLTGGGGRDKMLAWELKIIPQLTANGLGSYKLGKV